jgi:tRNA(fMet)-specific endonuclease VapC
VDLIADTTFLVGLWRKQPWAVDFARSNRQRILGIPWVVLGEFWNGAKRAGHDDERVRKFLSTGLPIGDAAPVVPFYAAVCFQAQEDGFYSAIGQNDLWIAATALSHALPLVTRNPRHFDKVNGLRVEVLSDQD